MNFDVIIFNLADCSMQHMKLCTFIILAAFKFGDMDPICQIVKLKLSPKFQRIWYRKDCLGIAKLHINHKPFHQIDMKF